MHRGMCGTLKHCTLVRSGKRWRVSIVSELGPAPEKREVLAAVGIDLGLKTFAVLSDGKAIEQPKWAKEAEQEIARKNQELATKKRGSRNRRKAKEQLRRAHERVANRRSNFCHQVSKRLVAEFDLIAFEALNVKDMVQGFMAKQIMAVAWVILLNQIRYKAAEAGAWAVGVNPRGTTKQCSGCGEEVPKTLAERVHSCPQCGLTMDRDLNAAYNILRLGRSLVCTLQESQQH
jgi:putative transposase